MKQPMNTMKLELDSRSVNERVARGALASFLASLDPTVEELTDLRTALSEAVTNCIVHAYPDTIGKIYITARLYEGGRVVILVKDKGCGIADIPRAMEPLFTTAPGEERSGLGFSVMESFCDKVKVRSRPGGPTTVTLERSIRSKVGNDV